ncbi:MAG: magnesium transporter [Parcubacteria group bacterium Gr01-1014_17]|nr:MAG: magnesium transporter [Parcubacteria group bacterium Gr01-1014_17]
MTTRREWEGVLWVDAENPTASEIRALIEEFNLPPAVGEPIPHRKKEKTEDTEDEIDFIIARRFFITVRYRHNDALYQLLKHADTAALVKAHTSAPSSGPALFAGTVKKLYERLFADVTDNSRRLTDIERDIFRGKEREMVAPLSEVGRELLDIKRAISFHKDLLESFSRIASAAFGAENAAFARHLGSEVTRLEFAVERNLDLLSELRESNNSLLDARETATMRVIAVVAFLTLPASIITNFFQMTTISTPLVGRTDDWFIITGMSVGLTVLLLLIAKTKKWF